MPILLGALIVGVWPILVATPVPASAPASQASTFAVIGNIELPAGSGFLENPYVSSDDTVYIPTGFDNYVAVIAPGKTSGALDDSIAADYPRAVALSTDDTLFIAEYQAQRVAVFAPGAASASYTIAVPDYPLGLASSADDTLVITQFFGTGGDVSLVSRGASVPAANISAPFGGFNPGLVAVNAEGDFYVGSDSNSVRIIPSAGIAFASEITALSLPVQPAFTSDDTLVVLNRGANQVAVFPAGALTPSSLVPVGNTPVALTVGPDDMVYVSNFSGNSVSQVDPESAEASTILTGMTGTHGLAMTSQGTLYVTTNYGTPNRVVVAQEVGAMVNPASGAAGSSVSVSLTGLPSGVVMDDSTVEAVWWGDDTIPFSRNVGTNSVSVTPPSGSGSVPIVIEVNGGSPLAGGFFTYVTPQPVPVVPPGVPRDVTATAGDASASVVWQPPTASGSFPVSTYQVTSTPGGHSCLTTVLSCTVTGLGNGTSYTFRVKALNGAGWGESSEPSNAITPRAEPKPAIMIAGTRSGRTIAITGEATGLPSGSVVTPWTRVGLGRDFTPGRDVAVADDGTFTWSRRASTKNVVHVYVTSDDVRSNVVRITKPVPGL